MKRIATIAASALLALGMGLLATAASKLEKVEPAKDYVKVDQKLIDKAAEDAVKDVDDVERKAFVEKKIKEAFKTYAAGKAAKVEVYEKGAIETLNAEKKSLQDTAENLHKRMERLKQEKNNAIKPYNDTIKDLRQKLKKENIDGRINAINEKHKADSLAQADNIKVLEAEISRLRAYSDSLADRNAVLANDAEIAKSVKKELDNRLGEVNALYDSYSGDSVSKVDSKEVEKTLGDYEDYLKIIGIPLAQEQKDKMELVRAVARVAKHYHDGIKILSEKYDAKAVQQWNGGVKSLTTSVVRLNNAQKQEWQRLCDAMNNIDNTMKYFREVIVQYVKDQGELPNKSVVKEVEDYVKLCVKNKAKAEYKDKDKFHPLYDHLNKVLEEMRDGLKVMDEKQYKAFVDKLEKSL